MADAIELREVDGVAVVGNYLEKLRMYYDTGIIKLGANVDVVHKSTCNIQKDDEAYICDCDADILVDGKVIGVTNG